jgi:REP element-mobilizing transposase RayT
LRILYPDAWYHVINRGRRRERLFKDVKDFKAFQILLKESVDLWGVRVAGYCLMTNHYHVLLQTLNANLPRCMRHIDGVYPPWPFGSVLGGTVVSRAH